MRNTLIFLFFILIFQGIQGEDTEFEDGKIFLTIRNSVAYPLLCQGLTTQPGTQTGVTVNFYPGTSGKLGWGITLELPRQEKLYENYAQPYLVPAFNLGVNLSWHFALSPFWHIRLMLGGGGAFNDILGTVATQDLGAFLSAGSGFYFRQSSTLFMGIETAYTPLFFGKSSVHNIHAGLSLGVLF